MIKLIFTLLLTPYLYATDYVDMGIKHIKIAQRDYLVIELTNEKGWHTYWKNPGDAGTPIDFKFYSEGESLSLKPLAWPAPKKYIEPGNMLAFGYSGTYSFFFELESSDFNKQVTADIKWLICKDICIPGGKKVNFKLSENVVVGKMKTKDASLEQLFKQLPQKRSLPANLELYLTKTDNENELALNYTLTDAKNFTEHETHNFLTPYLSNKVTFGHEKLFYDTNTKTLYGEILLSWDGIYEDPVVAMPANGIFSEKLEIQFLLYQNGKNSIYQTGFKQFSLTGHKALHEIFNQFSKDKNVQSHDKSIITYIIFALFGGLILNLMPCVLPVISLKLFGLISHSDESSRSIFKHNLSYTLGVLSSFWALALVFVLLKNAGESIGWGFQLQSATFVLLMILLIFIMSLNMFGLFEFVTPGGRTLGDKQLKRGFVGDFVSGVLATILSTPCSAPFLGTALTFALTTTYLNVFIMLSFVGLGLALPFIVTGIFPKLINFLPRPGIWMEKLKYFLAFTLLLTCIWLYDILTGLINMQEAGLYINSLVGGIFFFFFSRKYVSKKLIPNLLILLSLIFLMYSIQSKNLLHTSAVNQPSQSNWAKWSMQSMQEQKELKNWVFIDFTAKWCLTCKVNKKLVLDTDKFKDLAKEYSVILMRGDWTQRDEQITNFLASYKIVGVPAYFIQKPNGEVISLGETISVSKVKKILTQQN